MGKRRQRAQVVVARDDEAIEQRIFVVRGERVMLDAHLAELYGVETGRLNQAVRRNRARFPADFMFQLTGDEVRDLRSQNVISSSEGYGGRRYLPHAFTELGVAMVSSVLHSQRAIATNILIMRTFAQLRRAQGQYAELRLRLAEVVEKVEGHDEVLREILRALDVLAEPGPTHTRPIGFRPLSSSR